MGKTKKISPDQILNRMTALEPLFLEFAIPAIYIDSELEPTPLHMDERNNHSVTERVNVVVCDKIEKENADNDRYILGRCILEGRTIEIGENDQWIFEPVFTLQFLNQDGGIPEEVIVHEMLHAYQLNFQYIEDEDSLDEKIVRSGRRKAFNLLRKETRDMVNYCYPFYELVKKNNNGLKDHDELFYRKSLQLDLELGYSPGTVFGYGLAEMMEYISERHRS